jgi:hypothetical protein
MTADQDVDRRSSEAVIFARPVAMVPQRKDTANPSFETEDDTNSSEADDYELDYEMPIVEDHSIINVRNLLIIVLIFFIFKTSLHSCLWQFQRELLAVGNPGS